MPPDADQRLVWAYVAVVVSGARFEDERLGLLREIMTADEIERAKQAIALEILRRTPWRGDGDASEQAVWDRYCGCDEWHPNSIGNLAIALGGLFVTVFRGEKGWGWSIRPDDDDEPEARSLRDLPTEGHARLEAWARLCLIMRGLEPWAAYLEIALAGAKPDDPRLAMLMNLMPDDELERAREAVGLEMLRREPIPSRPN